MGKTWQQLEASRNTRLWITSVIIPLITLTGMVIIGVPELKSAIVKKAQELKCKRELKKRYKGA